MAATPLSPTRIAELLSARPTQGESWEHSFGGRQKGRQNERGKGKGKREGKKERQEL